MPKDEDPTTKRVSVFSFLAFLPRSLATYALGKISLKTNKESDRMGKRLNTLVYALQACMTPREYEEWATKLVEKELEKETGVA